MNFKLSAILGIALLISLGAFKLYYDKSEAEKQAIVTQLQQSMDNQLLLENSIAEQNAQITEQLQKEKDNQQRISNLTTANSAAQEEVNRLKNTFAKHDLNMLSMAKPGLIERLVNRGTARVGKELETLTNPNQFNEEIITNNTDTD